MAELKIWCHDTLLPIHKVEYKSKYLKKKT